MEICNDENVSRQLFFFLCGVFGSKKVVHVRRIFFQIMDDLFSYRNSQTFISSGSKAEGLNMSGSDVDYMTVFKQFPVFHDTYESDCRNGFLTDFDHSSPGFVLLKYISGRIHSELLTLSEYGIVLPSETFRSFILRQHDGQRGPPFCIIHGPCITSMFGDIDNAFCLKSRRWHKNAEQYLKRPRCSGWPLSDVMKRMALEGLLYVPIGSKFRDKESNPLEWRISFSAQEKMLVHSFNHTQIMCYVLLKLILKEVINTKNNVANLLCSYFLKTTVFWLSEETEILEWKTEKFVKCYKNCIQRLIYWVKIGYCPNYFIPENNMFAGKINGQKQNDLLVVLDKVYVENIQFIFGLPSLTKFIPDGEYFNYTEQHDTDVGLYPLFNIYLQFMLPRKNRSLYLSLLSTRIRKQSSNLYKSLYFRWLVYLCIHFITETPYKWYSNNKCFYPQYKQFRFYALLAKNLDPVSGWLWFSSFLYQHGDYHGALVVTSTILPQCTPDKFYVALRVSQKIDYDILSSRKFKFLERHKMCCIYQMFGTLNADSLFYNSDLSLNAFDSLIMVPPIVYLHFLRFMCFHRLANISERNKCILDIELTIENEFYVSTDEQRIISKLYLLKALEFSQNWSKYLTVSATLLGESGSLHFLQETNRLLDRLSKSSS